MNELTLKYCPSTLNEGFATFSPLALRRLFGGKKISHILNFTLENTTENTIEIQRISISGVQEKLSLLLENEQLRLVKATEHGSYILKPIPNSRFKEMSEVPANEHLTMQIARQVYQIETAENTLVFFSDGSPAYLTKRFDLVNNVKLVVEDFATLAGKSSQKEENSIKYEGSYEEMARLLQQYVPAYSIEIEKFFRLVLFNYLFSNGDAHLKNFSLIETPNGDMVLSPAYDLLCTRLHVNDSDMAMEDGLFSDDYETELFKANAFYAYNDFVVFGLKIGIKAIRLQTIFNHFQTDHPLTHQLIARSFLSSACKATYTNLYLDKLKRLRYLFE